MDHRTKIRRREFARDVGLVSVAFGLGGPLSACSSSPGSGKAPGGIVQFTHGVASGDPLVDRVILWTRAVPADRGSLSLQWEVSESPRFTRIVSRGQTQSGAQRDFTAKVDAHGLKPGRDYFYRFRAGVHESSIGRTRTLPDDGARLVRLATVSCSNYAAGYFHVYRELATRKLDAVLHLGDYIYEYGRSSPIEAMAPTLGRECIPGHELITLQDYRLRYAQYRSDPDLQAAHAAHPFIVVWDDHEFANDAWRGGAANHQSETEGRWDERRRAAVAAWLEWMPVREQPGYDRIWRQFKFGSAANLMMLDTRLRGRDEQVDRTAFLHRDPPDFAGLREAIASPDRALIDRLQREWLYRGLRESSATWQLIGQQVLMTSIWLPAAARRALIAGDLGRGIQLLHQSAVARSKQAIQRSNTEQLLLEEVVPFSLDSWDGYAFERESLLREAIRNGSRLVSLAGDSHNAWAGELRTAAGELAGIELACPSVSSPGAETYLRIPDLQTASRLEQALMAQVPELAYCNLTERGYCVLEISTESLQAEWIFVGDVRQKDPGPPRRGNHRIEVAISSLELPRSSAGTQRS